MLTLEGLTTGYRGNAPLLRGINAGLERGTLTALLGANGAGKSTLLATLAGRLRPLEGRVCIDGRDISRLSPVEMARLVSVVFPERGMGGALTVEQTVALGRHPHTGFLGRLTGSDRRIVNEAMEAMGIERLRERHTATLSDGERQKVMIARAIAQQTPVMLLDEPTAFLDVAARLDSLSLLRRLATELNVAVLLSTHDVAPALNAPADALWLLPGDGSMPSGTPEELAADGTLDRLFGARGVYFDRNAGDFRLNPAGGQGVTH